MLPTLSANVKLIAYNSSQTRQDGTKMNLIMQKNNVDPYVGLD
jgi:hypothetical protein